MGRIWRFLACGSRGTALWWGFQSVGLAILIAVLCADGKWLVLLASPLIFSAAWQALRAVRRGQIFW